MKNIIKYIMGFLFFSLMLLLTSCEAFEKQPEFFYSDVRLTSLTFSSGSLYPKLSDDRDVYTASAVRYDFNEYRVTAIGSAEHSKIEMSLNSQNPIELKSGEQSPVLDLIKGYNTIKILITAQDRKTNKEYIINVIKEYNADLLSLMPEAGTNLSPQFSPTERYYTVSYDNNKTTFEVTGTLSDSNAKLEFSFDSSNSYTEIVSGSLRKVTLHNGENIVRFRVENEITVKVYTITINKAYLVNVVRVNAIKNTLIQDKDVSLSTYRIGKYEVSYKEWYETLQWANSNGYTIQNTGNEGKDATGDVNSTQPVTSISWRDAIVWCNAISERDGLKPCYYSKDNTSDILKDSNSTDSFDNTASIDNPFVDWNASGYRLPTEAEWEYAARHISTTELSDATKASGETDTVLIGDVAWYSDNSGNTTNIVGKKSGNRLALFDMSGNVSELCFDVYSTDLSTWTETNPFNNAGGNSRVIRGGSWSSQADECTTGNRGSGISPWTVHNNTGFRIVVK